MGTIHIDLKTDTGTAIRIVLGENGYLHIDPAKGKTFFLIDNANLGDLGVVAQAMHASLVALACTLHAKWRREEAVGLPTEWLNEDTVIEAIRITAGSLLVNECGRVGRRSKGFDAGQSLLGSVVSDITVRVYDEEGVTL
jgi:hypothetical protein